MSEPDLRRFPFSRRLLVAVDAGRASRRVRALAGTSDRRRELLDGLGGATIALGGSALLPTGDRWEWPDAPFPAVTADLAQVIPGLRISGVVLPRQAGRPRVSMLGTVDGDEVIVKLGLPDDGLENEAAALRLLTATPLPTIATPRVVAAGRLASTADVAFLATSALGLQRQRPAIDEPLTSFESDLARCLAALPRPPGTAADAVPVHGDLAPWNLRRTGRGLALFDWEEAGWGPAGSDLAYYRRACASL